MTDIYTTTITDEKRAQLDAWKAANEDNPTFQDLMAKTAIAHAALVKLASHLDAPRGVE